MNGRISKGRGGFVKGRGQTTPRSGLPILPPWTEIPSLGVRPPSTGYGTPTFGPRIGRIFGGVRRTIFGRR